MAQRFEISGEMDVQASPAQVWEAITTGRGQDSWFMGRSDIEPREGGTTRWSIGEHTELATVTTWEPERRFVNSSEPGPDGGFHQFDYRIEDLGGGRTSVRYTHSGMLGGDWEAEYEAMQEGDPMYFHKLYEYLTYFQGRFAVGVMAFGPDLPDDGAFHPILNRALGLGDAVALDQPVRLAPAGFDAIDGTVDALSAHFLGVRSDDAMYRFIHGFNGTTMVGHHLFAEGADQAAAEAAWTAWLERTFDPGAANGSGEREG